MNNANIKEAVRERWKCGASSDNGRKFVLRRSASRRLWHRPDNFKPLRRRAIRPDSSRSNARFARLRESHGTSNT
jgi:hypothetical protein